MPRWRVWLTGPKHSFRLLANECSGSDWDIEYDDSVGSHYIRANSLEKFDKADAVRESATKLVDLISIAAESRWGDFDTISVGAVHDMRANNTTVMVGTAKLCRKDPDQDFGTITERMEVLRRYPELAKALRKVRDGSDWTSLYIAYEAIGYSGEIVKLGITTKKACKRFTGSSQHGRHDEPTYQNPMPLDEGRAWIRNIVRQLVAVKLREHHHP